MLGGWGTDGAGWSLSVLFYFILIQYVLYELRLNQSVGEPTGALQLTCRSLAHRDILKKIGWN